MPHPVIVASDRYKAALLARERQAATRLVQAYGTAYQRLEIGIGALAGRIAGLTRQELASQTRVKRLDAMVSLRGQIADEINRFCSLSLVFELT